MKSTFFSIPVTVLFAALLLMGCAGNKGANKTPPPDWIGQRPLSSAYYIGIGSAPKIAVTEDALSNAKKRAAADLASEIAVKVESASLLENADNNGTVSERFTSSITSHTDERIAGFEVVDIWEDDTRVHVYYRLNKARHAQAKAARRNTAIESALVEFELGTNARVAGQVPQALNHFGAGVMALEEFWNEVNRAEIDGQMVTVEPHLLRAMRNTILEMQTEGVLNSVELSAENNFKFPLGLNVTIDGQAARGVPLKYQYHNGTYMKRATEFTDDMGNVVALISEVGANRPDVAFAVEIDTDRLWKAANVDPVISDLVGSVTTPVLLIPIALTMPSVFIAAGDGGAVSVAQQEGVLTALRNALRSEGFDVVAAPQMADYALELNLRKETRTPTGDLSQFHTVYVDGVVKVRNAEGQTIQEVVTERVKGVQLNAQSALNLALNKTAKTMERTVGKKIASALK
ncbi:MAG: LPP20 family lipoprotein [Flavobacteriales bacterium]|nr:LPP20 family lipoprotein [Flavobacteriales bacterium]